MVLFGGKMGGQKTGKDFDISASKKAVEQSNRLPDDFRISSFNGRLGCPPSQ